MIEVPFAPDYPVSIGIFALIVGLLFAALRMSYDRGPGWGRAIGDFVIALRFGRLPQDMQVIMYRRLLFWIAGIFLVMALVSFVFAVGLLKGPEEPPLYSPEELQQYHEEFKRRHPEALRESD